VRVGVGSQPKSRPTSVADRGPGPDVGGAHDVTADAVSGSHGDDRPSSAAGDHVRHDEELSAHAWTADGGDRGRHLEHPRRLFATHRLPRSSPRLQLGGKSNMLPSSAASLQPINGQNKISEILMK